MEARLIEEPGEVRIAKRMLAHPMGYLNDARRLPVGRPSITGNFNRVVPGPSGL